MTGFFVLLERLLDSKLFGSKVSVFPDLGSVLSHYSSLKPGECRKHVFISDLCLSDPVVVSDHYLKWRVNGFLGVGFFSRFGVGELEAQLFCDRAYGKLLRVRDVDSKLVVERDGFLSFYLRDYSFSSE